MTNLQTMYSQRVTLTCKFVTKKVTLLDQGEFDVFRTGAQGTYLETHFAESSVRTTLRIIFACVCSRF